MQTPRAAGRASRIVACVSFLARASTTTNVGFHSPFAQGEPETGTAATKNPLEPIGRVKSRPLGPVSRIACAAPASTRPAITTVALEAPTRPATTGAAAWDAGMQ